MVQVLARCKKCGTVFDPNPAGPNMEIRKCPSCGSSKLRHVGLIEESDLFDFEEKMIERMEMMKCPAQSAKANK